MVNAPEPDLEELLWTIAVARIILDTSISLQVPPNLNDGKLAALLGAGINDWGGVSPITPDHVNPEAPWPHLEDLAQQTAQFQKTLCERLTIYPKYIHQADEWMDPPIARSVLESSDASGLARTGTWTAGLPIPPTEAEKAEIAGPTLSAPSDKIGVLLERTMAGKLLSDMEVARLFEARGPEVAQVCQAADALRQSAIGDAVTFVVNRNINYTNICTYSCGFCAFSKGKTHDDLRGTPYDLNLEEIQRRASEAWERGATEVCLQGGIHPAYTGETYLGICRAIKEVAPDIHIHAFSPLEIWQGATTLGMDLPTYFKELRQAGLKTLPGTAAEILDDEVRTILCADKLTTDLWLDIISEAHNQGINTTSTIMFGHVDQPIHWARHLRRLRDLQLGSLKHGRGKITEFVPLPFVHMESPIFTKSGTRKGPTFREAVLMHAVARLVLNPVIPNIQTSWTKMGTIGAQTCLQSGANDLGGTLMNESISRAAGASNGQELPASAMVKLVQEIRRTPQQRTTTYGAASTNRTAAANSAPQLLPIINTPPRKRAATAKQHA
jgi:FO synthase